MTTDPTQLGTSRTPSNPVTRLRRRGSRGISLTLVGAFAFALILMVPVNASGVIINKGGGGGGPLTVTLCLMAVGGDAGCSTNLVTWIAPDEIWYDAVTGGGTQPYTFSWSFGDGGTSTSQFGYYTYDNPSTSSGFPVKVTVSEASGSPVAVSGSVDVQAMPVATQNSYMPVTVQGVVSLTTCNGGIAINPTSVCPDGTSSAPKGGLEVMVWWRPQGQIILNPYNHDQYDPLPWINGPGTGPSSNFSPEGVSSYAYEMSMDCGVTAANGSFSITTGTLRFWNSVAAQYSTELYMPQPYGILAPDGNRYTFLIQIEPFDSNSAYNPANTESFSECPQNEPFNTAEYTGDNTNSPADAEDYFTNFLGGYPGSANNIVDSASWPVLVQGPSAYYDDPADYSASTCPSGSSAPCEAGALTVAADSGSVSQSSASFSITPDLSVSYGPWSLTGQTSVTVTSATTVAPVEAGTTLYGNQCSVNEEEWSGDSSQSVGTCSVALMFENQFWICFAEFGNTTAPYTGPAVIAMDLVPIVNSAGAQLNFASNNPVQSDSDGIVTSTGFQAPPSTSGSVPTLISIGGNPYCVLKNDELLIPATASVDGQDCGIQVTQVTNVVSTLTISESLQIPIGDLDLGGFTVSGSWTQTYTSTNSQLWVLELMNPQPSQQFCFNIWQDGTSTDMGAVHVWPAPPASC